MIKLIPPNELGARVAAVAEEFPVGSTVWHRANGTRGVVEEYAVDGQGCIMVVIGWGAGMNWDKCSVTSLSSTKVTDDDNGGDAWPQQEHN